MASIIRVKRSTGNQAPSTINFGELAVTIANGVPVCLKTNALKCYFRTHNDEVKVVEHYNDHDLYYLLLYSYNLYDTKHDDSTNRKR